MRVKYQFGSPYETEVMFDNRQELKDYLRDCGWYLFSDLKSILQEFNRKGYVIFQ